jgi:hypothetical protein
MTRSPAFVASESLTFVATFGSDGTAVITRMTTFTLPGKLDLVRGVRLSRAAFESRMKRPAPAITSAHFERNNEVLKTYTHEELEAVS